MSNQNKQQYEVTYKVEGRKFMFNIEHHIIGSDKRHHIRVTSKEPLEFLQVVGRDKKILSERLKYILLEEAATLYPLAKLDEITFTSFDNTLVRLVGAFNIGDS